VGALAVTSATKSSMLPEYRCLPTPSGQEAKRAVGMAPFSLYPKNTPKEIIAKLNQWRSTRCAGPGLKAKMVDYRREPLSARRKAFGAMIVAEQHK